MFSLSTNVYVKWQHILSLQQNGNAGVWHGKSLSFVLLFKNWLTCPDGLLSINFRIHLSDSVKALLRLLLESQ